MKALPRWRRAVLAGVYLGLSGLAGCQTWVGGMTLPSGHYLEHRPQYFPPEPVFPLERELATQAAQSGLAPGVSAIGREPELGAPGGGGGRDPGLAAPPGVAVPGGPLPGPGLP
jgi:hypothetical protein